MVLLVSFLCVHGAYASITVQAKLHGEQEGKAVTKSVDLTFADKDAKHAFIYNDKEININARAIDNKKARILIELFKVEKDGTKTFMGRPTMTARWGKTATFKAPKRAKDNLTLTFVVNRTEEKTIQA